MQTLEEAVQQAFSAEATDITDPKQLLVLKQKYGLAKIQFTPLEKYHMKVDQ